MKVKNEAETNTVICFEFAMAGKKRDLV